MNKDTASRSHSETVVQLLQEDPELATIYLNTAIEESHLPGGEQALLNALRYIAEAQGMAKVAEQAGLPRESLYRALGPKGNPTFKTFLAILKASGIQMSFQKS